MFIWTGSTGSFTRYSDKLHDFSFTIPGCYKDAHMSTVSFLTQLGSIIICQIIFSLVYDLNGFKSRINRHLLTLGSFKTYFLYALIFFASFSCNCMPRSVCSTLHGVNLNLKKPKRIMPECRRATRNFSV